MDEVVIDPDLPEEIKRRLRRAPARTLIGYSEPLPERGHRGRISVFGVRVSGVSRMAPVSVAYHRRYVVPAADFDPDTLRLWKQIASVAQVIRYSGIVSSGLIQSSDVGYVLPYYLWDAATRLASAPRDPGPGQEQAQEDAQRLLRGLTSLARRFSEAYVAMKRADDEGRKAGLDRGVVELITVRGHAAGVTERPAVSEHQARRLNSALRKAIDRVHEADEAAGTLRFPVDTSDWS